jgi:hypothetical protein
MKNLPGYTNGRTDRVIPIYPQTLLAGGITNDKEKPTHIHFTFYMKISRNQSVLIHW